MPSASRKTLSMGLPVPTRCRAKMSCFDKAVTSRESLTIRSRWAWCASSSERNEENCARRRSARDGVGICPSVVAMLTSLSDSDAAVGAGADVIARVSRSTAA